MTIQPFKNYAEKENFEKELKEMILTPKRNKQETKWQSAINRVHSKWCKDNGYSTNWDEIRVGRPKQQNNRKEERCK